MADLGQNTDTQWRTSQFRQKVIAQIEEAMRNSGNTTGKSSTEMESLVYARAKTREEYLGFVARLIIHVREAYQKKSGVGGLMGGPPGGGGGMPDPLGALTNLTKGGGLQQPGAMVGGPPQQQQTGLVGPARGGPGMPPSMGQPFTTYGPGHQQMMGGPQRPQHMQQQPQVSRGGMDPFGGMMVGQPQHMAAQMGAGGGGFPPAAAMGTPYGGPQPGAGGVVGGMAGAGGNMSQPQQSPSGGLPGQSPAPYMSQPSPMGGGGMGPSPAGAGLGAPSPGGPLNTPGNPYSQGPLTSPAGPSALQMPASMQAGTRTDDAEERRYLEKLRQLSKYIDPLKRMLKRIENDEERKQDKIKVGNLLEILSDTKRMQFSGLIKCEEVLKKLNFEFIKYPGSSGGVSITTPTATTAAPDAGTSAAAPAPSGAGGFVPVAKPGAPLCQTLLDTIAAHSKSPVLNHTLQRTFGPAMAAINGPPVRSGSPPPAKRPRRRLPSPAPATELPMALQGEIARLQPRRFSVTLDPATHHSGSANVHLTVSIDDKHLPAVPPISVSIPEDYPQTSPTLDSPAPHTYDSTPFLQRVEKHLSSQVLQLPDRFSLTALLNTWELSIRRACAPPAAQSL